MNTKTQTQNNLTACIFFLLFMLAFNQTHAQLAAWSPAGLSGYGPSPWSPTTSNANVTIGGLTRGSGIGLSGTAAGNAWGGVNWAGGETQDASFTITPKTCYTMSISSLELRYRRSGTGPATGNLQYSINGGAYTVITTYSFPSTSTAASGQDAGTVSLSSISALQNVTAGTIVKFRILPSGGGSAGTWYVFGTGASGGNALVLNGTVTAVPNQNITASAGTGGTISPPGVTGVTCGTNRAYTITPNACYAISNVLVDGVSQGAISSYTFTNVTAPHTISASFTQLTHSITASAGANGSISPTGSSTVNCGNNAVYSITPGSCYKVEDVVVDGVSQGAVTSYTFSNINTPHSIHATFEPDPAMQSSAASGAAGSAPEVCAGATVTLTAQNGTLAAGADWVWYEGGCGNGSPVGNGVSVQISPSAGMHTYYVRAEGSCNTTACEQVNVLVSAAPPATDVVMPINNLPVYACDGTSAANLNVAAVAGATQYIWDGPAGTTFSGGNNPYISSAPTADILFGSPGSSSGYYIGLQAANACGATARKTKWVRNTLSVPAFVSPAATTCPGNSYTYTISSVTGALNYTYTAPSGATINGSAPPFTTTLTSVTIDFPPGFTSGQVCATANTSCYSTPLKCVNVTKAATQPGALNGAFTVCPGTTQSYHVPFVPGTYTWTLPANTTGSSTSNSINVTYGPGFTSGNISVTHTNVCGSISIARAKSATTGAPSTPASISGQANGLCSTTSTFSCPPLPGVSYVWTLPATASGSSASNSISVAFGMLTTGSVCVKATNSCGTSSQRCITVKGAPNTPPAINTPSGTWCAPSSGIEFQSDVAGTIGGSYTLNWAWTPASAATYVLGQNTNNLFLDWNEPGAAVVSLTASNACGSGTRTLPVNINNCSSARMGPDNATTEGSNFSIYPNPASDMISIDFNSVREETFDLNLLSLSGRVIMTKTIHAKEGLNSEKINLSTLAQGVYILHIKASVENKMLRVIVQ